MDTGTPYKSVPFFAITLLISWSKNKDLDFDRYELRRSEEAGVGEDAPLVISLTDRNRLSHLDTGLTENTEYHYRVFVVDKEGVIRFAKVYPILDLPRPEDVFPTLQQLQ